MRILYLTAEAPFDPAAPATGNQLRADRLMRALQAHGIDTLHRWRDAWTDESIAESIEQERPDCLILGYWQLAEQLPADCHLPVVADFRLRTTNDPGAEPVLPREQTDASACMPVGE